MNKKIFISLILFSSIFIFSACSREPKKIEYNQNDNLKTNNLINNDQKTDFMFQKHKNSRYGIIKYMKMKFNLI